MISIVIPTLQKRVDILKNLIESLNCDSSVGEIIVINNAIKPLEFEYEKLRVITPDENMYVNPAWNKGIEEARYETVGLLNDDIVLCDNFCSSLIKALPDNYGVVGYCKENIEPIEDNFKKPDKGDIKLQEVNFIDFGFGIAMFFDKTNYSKIPDNLKIMYGDCYIFEEYKKRKFKNYKITGQKIIHIGSLTTSNKIFNPVINEDKKIYKKITIPWYKYFFSIQEYADCKKMRLLGFNIRLFSKKGK